MINLKIDAGHESQCTGKVYKASVQKFPTTKGFGMSIRLNELKRKSCSCDKCQCLEDEISESMCDEGIIGLEDVKDGKLYTVGYTNITTDWESGIVDGWDLELIEIEER
ncbi:MAG: hypothetical protein WC055_00805 [Melioribacteraceae bacterium]